MSSSPSDHLIVAVDVSTATEAQEIVYELGDSVCFYKIGLQLFTSEGPKIVSELVSSGRKVFLDLKLHDIPNTVGGAVKAAAELGVHMLTVHAAGGSKMLKEAVAAARTSATHPIILGVTVLTSFAPADLEESGVRVPLSDQVRHLAEMSRLAGCGGIVTSPQEEARLRSFRGREFAIVTPGIRPAGSEAKDQVRIATPAAAIRAGASHLVVGRPITAAANRNQAANAILNEIGSALHHLETEMAGTRPA